jgi:hypothetical protein
MNLSIVLYIGAIMCIPRGYGPIIAENGIIVHYVISAAPYYCGKSAERSSYRCRDGGISGRSGIWRSEVGSASFKFFEGSEVSCLGLKMDQEIQI